MNRHDALERELTAWFADVAAPRVPDYVNDIVQGTAGRRQRPRWTFLQRWLPMTLMTLHPVPTRRFPWRTVGLLAVIAALLAALVVVSVGSSQRRVPAPFGLAANGLVAYAAVGDVWAVDPQTGERRAIATGPERDHDPRWSPDGTRIAFLRDVQGLQQAVIVGADGREPAIVSSRPLGDADSDAFKWSPDGTTLAVTADVGSVGTLFLVDADSGAVTTLPVDYAALEPYWRPPDGRELLFVSGTSGQQALSIYSLDSGLVRNVRVPAAETLGLRPMGWTPDGQRVLVYGLSGDQTLVIDVDTGDATTLDVGYGHVSNAGDRVAGVREAATDEAICVVAIDGGPCRPVGPGWARPSGWDFESIQWSPDDRWIAVQPEDGSQPALLDPLGGGDHVDAEWIRSGAESWQRVAP